VNYPLFAQVIIFCTWY